MAFDNHSTAAPEAPRTAVREDVLFTAVDVLLWDILGNKGRAKAQKAFEKRAAGMERYAQEELGLLSSQRPENVTPLRAPRGAGRVLEDAAESRRRAERASAAIARAAAVRQLITELF